MAVQLCIFTFLCGCLCHVVALETTTIAFSENNKIDVNLSINIVNPLDTVVQVNISALRISSFPTRRELVEPKDVIVIDIDRTDFEITGTGKTGKGIFIQFGSSELIITGLSTASSSTDMYFARNNSQLGTEYIIITHCEMNCTCQFAVIAREENTTIEITFPVYFAASVVFDGEEYGPCDVMTITLQESETFQIQSKSDLSGVRIVSSNEKQFSVLSGSSFTKMQAGLGIGGDHIADMVPPIAAWGNEYIIVRRNLTDYLRDYVKIVVTSGGANISITGCGNVLYHQILGFQTYLYSMTCERVHIISDEPVLTAHFPVGAGHGDPAMFFPTPTDHYVSEYTVYIPPGFSYCAIALVMETVQVNSFDLTKFTNSFTQWKEIGQSVYSAAWLSNLGSGVMEITHTSSFGGHLICERSWSIIALPIGLGNVILNEPQENTSIASMAECSTIPNETTTDVTSSTTGTSDITLTSENSADLTTSQLPTNASGSAYTLSTTGTSDITMTSENTADVTTRQLQTNASGSMLNCSCCITPSFSDSNLPPPPEELLEMINKLKKLSVPKNNTSKYIRKLTSAWDNRSSSAAIGGLGCGVLFVVFGSSIAIDLATLFQKRK